MNKTQTPVLVKRSKKIKKQIKKSNNFKTQKAIEFYIEDFTKEINEEQ